MEMDNELSHAGVQGMKWGVRKDRKSSSSSKPAKSSKPKAEKKRKKKSSEPTAIVRKTRRGMKVVAKHENTKVKVFIANATAISAGALRVAACFVPGGAALTAAANAATLANVVVNVKK